MKDITKKSQLPFLIKHSPEHNIPRSNKQTLIGNANQVITIDILNYQKICIIN